MPKPARPAQSSPSGRRIECALMLIGSLAAAGAVVQYLAAARSHFDSLSMGQLGICVFCAVTAVIAVLHGRPTTTRSATQPSPAGRLLSIAFRLTTFALAALLVVHVRQAYWAAVFGPNALPGLYRYMLLLSLLVGVLLPAAYLLRVVLGARRAAGPVASLAALGLVLFSVEVVWSAIAPPFPGPLKIAGDGGYISQPIDEPARGYPYLYRPDIDYHEQWGSDPRDYFDPGNRLTYRINSLGLRGPLPDAATAERTRRIVLLGDSFTFGEGVRDSHTLPAQLAASLSDRFDGDAIECVNAGVGGFDTAQEVGLYQDLLASLHPDAVVVVMGLNDKRPSSDKQQPTWAPSELERLSVLLTKARLAVARWSSSDTPDSIDSYARCFDAIETLAQSLDPDQHLLVAIYPYVDILASYPHTDLHDAIVRRLDRMGIDTVDLLPPLARSADVDLTVHRHQDTHPNEAAHKIAAAALADRLHVSLAGPRVTPLARGDTTDHP